MTKYVAFLRGVNVGGRVVKMADLKVCFEDMGFTDVSTILQTGNVVFESDLKEPQLKLKIEKALTETFNYPAIAQVMSLSVLKKVIEGYPFGDAGPKQHDYLIFIENGLEQEILNDPYELGAGEKVQKGKGVVYWRVDQGKTLRSSFGKTLSKTKYKNFNTNRNIKTLRKILIFA